MDTCIARILLVTLALAAAAAPVRAEDAEVVTPFRFTGPLKDLELRELSPAARSAPVGGDPADVAECR